MAPQALGYRIAGLSEHEHDGRGATVSLLCCLASSLFYVHAYIYLSIYIQSIIPLHIPIHIITYIHNTLLTYIHASMHPRAYVRTPISRGSQLLAGRRRGDWLTEIFGQ